MSSSKNSELNKQLVSLLLEKCDKLNYKKENQHNNNYSVAAAREHIFLDRLDNALDRVFKNKIAITKYKSPNKGKIERVVNLVLSDLHFGSDLDPEEVPIAYGKIEETRRFASIIKQTIDFKPQYRNETSLNVHLLGDLYQGKLHDPQANAALAEQFARTVHLLVEGLEILAIHFPRGVHVRALPGNHGRDTKRHQGRAVDQRWDSDENKVYYAVKKALRKVPNLKFDIPKTSHYVVDIFNKKGYFSHGDVGIEVPFPSSNINITKIKHQMNEFNVSLIEDGKGCDLFCFGHTHTDALIELNNAILMVNGALVPPDPYTISRGIHKTSCGQRLFESVHNYIVGDTRRLRVGKNTDQDSSLDLLIKPFDKF